MLKSLLALFLIVGTFTCFAQIGGVVTEAGTNKAIPYVNIGAIGQTNGTSCSVNGHFEIDVSQDDSLVFSAVGYHAKRMAVKDLRDTLFLEKQVARLREVVVRPGDSSEEITLGEYKANRIRYLWSTGGYSVLLARYFAFPANAPDVFFLDQLSILTKSEVDGAKFIIRIYGVAPDGSPGQYLHGENIFAYAPKGWKRTEVDLSDLNIAFPENGLFVAVESLRITENKYTLLIDNHFDESKKPKKIEVIRYAPLFGLLPKGGDEWGWRFSQGEWKHEKKEMQVEPTSKKTPAAVALTVKH